MGARTFIRLRSLKPILDSMVVWGTDYQRRNGGAACAQ